MSYYYNKRNHQSIIRNYLVAKALGALLDWEWISFRRELRLPVVSKIWEAKEEPSLAVRVEREASFATGVAKALLVVESQWRIYPVWQ